MQLDIIHTLQSFRNPSLTFFFELITTLGATQIYILIMPIVIWCISPRNGYRLLLIVLLSAYLNSLLKELGPLMLAQDGMLRSVRPFRANPETVWTCRRDPTFDPQAFLARFCYEEESNAFPSGHAQTSLVMWSYLITLIHKRWFTTIAVTLIILIGVSRLYLGQHWPTDVLGGWLIGAAVLGMAYGVTTQWRDRQRLVNRVLLALMIVFGPVLFLLDSDPTLNRTRAVGLIIGTSIGYRFYLLAPPFVVKSVWLHQLAKLAIGSSGIVVLQLGLGTVLPPTALFTLSIALLIGGWITWGAPLVFAWLWPHHLEPNE